MDSSIIRKIMTGKTQRVTIDKIKIGDIVKLSEDNKGNLLVVDMKDNSIKKIISNGDEVTSAIFRRGNTFSVISKEEYLINFGQVVSIERKAKSSLVLLRFKEKIQGKQEYEFKSSDKIRRIV